MIKINGFAVIICMIWICCTVVSIALKNATSMIAGAVVTTLIGFGYFLLKDKY